MIICPPPTHPKEYIFIYTLDLYSKVRLSAPPRGWNLLTPNIEFSRKKAWRWDVPLLQEVESFVFLCVLAKKKRVTDELVNTLYYWY